MCEIRVRTCACALACICIIANSSLIKLLY